MPYVQYSQRGGILLPKYFFFAIENHFLSRVLNAFQLFLLYHIFLFFSIKFFDNNKIVIINKNKLGIGEFCRTASPFKAETCI